MELIFINVAIIVFFLGWAFLLILKSCGADIRDEDEEEAWQKYVESRIRRNKFDENKQMKELREQKLINRAIEKAKKIK